MWQNVNYIHHHYLIKFHKVQKQKFADVEKSPKFTVKHLCQSLFCNEKETPTKVFSCEYCEIFKNIYFEEHLRTAVS